ncbi:hypothetical protein GW17_00058716 [Ensete ventricosum]|nr:hypothetical protein GW17_00058716 [Ensete ventricosum]
MGAKGALRSHGLPASSRADIVPATTGDVRYACCTGAAKPGSAEGDEGSGAAVNVANSCAANVAKSNADRVGQMAQIQPIMGFSEAHSPEPHLY